MKTASVIVLVASLAACSPSEQGTDGGGKVICSNTGECIHADFYAACFHSGALVPVQLDGGMLAPAPISAPPPDGGGKNVAAFPQSLLFTDATTLWLADTIERADRRSERRGVAASSSGLDRHRPVAEPAGVV